MPSEDVALFGSPATATPDLGDFLQPHAARGESFEEASRSIHSLIGERIPEQVRPAYDQQAGLAHASSLRSQWSPSTLEVAQENMVPFYSTIHQFNQTNAHTEASRRLQAGTATPEDFDVIARHERQAGLYERAGFPAQVTRTIAGLPAIAGEAYVGGRLIGAAGQALGATRLAAGAAAQAPRLTAAAGWAGRTAATTAAMPSMYLPEAAQNAAENGGNWSDARNLGPAYGVGFLNTAVLGSVMGHGGPKGVTGYLARIAVGMGEQQAADTISAMSGMRRHGGILENMWAGQYGEAAQHATLQALTFGMLGSMHHDWAPSENPVLQSVREAFDFAGRSARRSEAAAEMLRQGQAPMQAALQANPNLTRAEAMDVVQTLPEGPARDHARAIAQAMPTEVSRAARERPSLEQNQAGMGELEQGQPMPPGEARTSPPVAPPAPSATVDPTIRPPGPPRNPQNLPNRPPVRPGTPEPAVPPTPPVPAKPFAHMTPDQIEQASTVLAGKKLRTADSLIDALKKKGHTDATIQTFSDKISKINEQTSGESQYGTRKRAALELQPGEPVAVTDVDKLGDYGTKNGKEKANAVIQAKADALKKAGLEPYHDNQDEFVVKGKDGERLAPQELAKRLELANQYLREATGQTFSFGVGGNLASADNAMRDAKQARTKPVGDPWTERVKAEVAKGRSKEVAEGIADGFFPRPKAEKDQPRVVPTTHVEGTPEQRAAILKQEMRMKARDSWNEMSPRAREAAARAMKAAEHDQADWPHEWSMLDASGRQAALESKPEVRLDAQEAANARSAVDVRESKKIVSDRALAPTEQRAIDNLPENVSPLDRRLLEEHLRGNSPQVIADILHHAGFGVTKKKISDETVRNHLKKLQKVLREHDPNFWPEDIHTIATNKALTDSVEKLVSGDRASKKGALDSLADINAREVAALDSDVLERRRGELEAIPVGERTAEDIGELDLVHQELLNRMEADSGESETGNRQNQNPGSKTPLQRVAPERLQEGTDTVADNAQGQGSPANGLSVEGQGPTGLRRPGTEADQPADPSATAGGSQAGGDFVEPKGQPKTILSLLKRWGGLSAESARQHGIDLKMAREAIPSIFRNAEGTKGTLELSEAAERLVNEGHLVVPNERHAHDWLIEKITEGAELVDRGLDAELFRKDREYQQKKAELEGAGYDKESIAAAETEGRTLGETQGRQQAAEDVYQEHVAPGEGGENGRTETAQTPGDAEPTGSAASGSFNAAGELLDASGNVLFRGESTGGGNLTPPVPGMGAASGGTPAGSVPQGAPGAGAPVVADRLPAQPASTWFRQAADWIKSFGNQAFPALTRLAKSTGEKLAQVANAPQAAKSMWDYVSHTLKVEGKALADLSPEERRWVGAVWLERRFRQFRDYLFPAAGESSDQGVKLLQASRASKDPKEKMALLQASRAAFNKANELGQKYRDVTTLVGQKDSPLATEADFQNGQERLWSFFEAVKQEWTPEVDKNFRSLMNIDPFDAINAPSQIPGLPLNAIALTEAEATAAGGISTNRRQGMENLKIRRPGFAREAGLDAPFYDVDIAHMMQKTLSTGIPAARRAEFVKTGIKEGVIEAVTGSEKPTEGFRYLALDPAHGLAGLDPNARYYAHPEVYKDVIQGLGIGERPGQTMGGQVSRFVMDKVYNLALMSPVELATHTANHFTALFRSGMGVPIANLKDTFTNAWGLWHGDPEMLRKVKDLAAMGASFGHEARPGILGERLQKYDPSAWVNKFTSKFIDTMQKAVRVQLGDAYDKMQQSGHFPLSETAKRDFINQALGNYSSQSNNRLTQFLKDTGLQGFATAAHTYTAQGIKVATGGAINAPATSWRAAAELRAVAALKLMPFLAMGPVLNLLFWGKAFPANVPAFGIKTREDEEKTHYFDPLAFTGWRRGARATGLNALVEAAVQGDRTAGQTLDHAARDARMTLVHLVEGPPAQFAHTLATGENALGHRVAAQVSHATTPQGMANAQAQGQPLPGSSQFLENAKAAAMNVNPLVSAFGQGDRPQTPRKIGENIFRSLGPFGERERTNRAATPPVVVPDQLPPPRLPARKRQR